MKATEAKFLDFLKRSPQFIIPIYQRTYSWDLGQCEQLWEDILRTGRSSGTLAHFVGSIVYIEQGLYQISSQSPVLVIDGQQRLATLSLILEALSRRLGETEPVDGFSATKLRNYYLLNNLEKGERAFKILLTQTDKGSLLSLMQQQPWPSEVSLRIKENFEFFESQIKDLGEDLIPLCNGLAKLVIVDISLSRDQDNPQLIFESMNSTGKELSQADLIRNFVLMGLEPEKQEKLYTSYWRPMEVEFGQEAYGDHFDGFMRHYLTYKTGDIPNINQVYEAFKSFARTQEIVAIGTAGLVADIHKFATYYCAMALGKETDEALSDAFQDLREFRVDVSYPFLLALYEDYKDKLLLGTDFAQAIRLVESYVFRRAICNLATNSLNKTFATMGRFIDKDNYLESIQAYLLKLPSYRRFPRDDEFMREIKQRDLYNFPRRSYWLRRMENFNRKERVVVGEYTIEHIMPQNQDLPTEWRTDLGNEWQRIHETWLHTLGNLTLTGYNSEYSDRSFREKRDMEGGFRHSPLKLNEGLSEVNIWNEDAIEQRAKRLSRLAVEVWSIPGLDSETLEKYSSAEKRAGYTITDHPYILPAAPMHNVYVEFRKNVLAIDQVVIEEFLKKYVAYKAESNFVDIVPQAAKLRLSLNMAFHEINDPRGICKDVTGLGRWGNGDVEIGLSSVEEIPYVMGLVRQAFEKQMGNSKEE